MLTFTRISVSLSADVGNLRFTWVLLVQHQQGSSWPSPSNFYLSFLAVRNLAPFVLRAFSHHSTPCRGLSTLPILPQPQPRPGPSPHQATSSWIPFYLYYTSG